MNTRTVADLTTETLEQAVGGSDLGADIAEEGKKNQYINEVIRPAMEAVREQMSHVSRISEEYSKLQIQLESLKGKQDSLTSSNQLVMIGINSRMSNSDNCRKMVTDSARAHADSVKNGIQFR
ncbi:MAG: hypothetical protein WCP79_08330 [Bacillota bacterium]